MRYKKLSAFCQAAMLTAAFRTSALPEDGFASVQGRDKNGLFMIEIGNRRWKDYIMLLRRKS
jgi:hypothetical protein